MVHQLYLKSQISLTNLNKNITDLNKNLLTLFQTDWRDLQKNKFQIAKQTPVTPNEIDTWFYFTYEEFVQNLNDNNKQEKEENEKRNKEHGETMGKFNPSSIMNKFNPSKFGGNMSAFPRI